MDIKNNIFVYKFEAGKKNMYTALEILEYIYLQCTKEKSLINNLQL